MVLLVEDEPVLRTSMARGLARLAGVTVVEAGSVREARRAMESSPPDLLLSDLDLPDGSGIEVASLLDRKDLRVPIVFVSAYVGKYRAQLARRTDVEIHEKPVPLDRLRSIVEAALDGAGDPPPFGVADYVQLAALGRRSVVLEVRGVRTVGRIVIEGGEVHHASDERGGGVDAFGRMAFLEGALVHCRALGRGESFDPNVSGSGESILLEAARRHDEEGSASPAPLELDLGWEAAEPSGSDATAEPRPAPTAPRPAAPAAPPASSRRHVFEQLYDDAIEALLARDFARAFVAFGAADDVSPDDPRVRANLARLRTMGYGS